MGLYKKLSSYRPVFVNVEEIVVHPKRDIALIKLEKSVKFNGGEFDFYFQKGFKYLPRPYFQN